MINDEIGEGAEFGLGGGLAEMRGEGATEFLVRGELGGDGQGFVARDGCVVGADDADGLDR